MLRGIFEYITDITGNNQFLTAAISAWILGVLTFVCRSIPRRVGQLAIKHLTTSFTVTTYHQTYYDIMAWHNKQGYISKLRRINLMNGRWGEDKSERTIGEGNHIVWYKWRPLFLSLSTLDSSATDRDKFSLKITLIGRSHSFFNRMLEEIASERGDDGSKTKIRRYENDYWGQAIAQPKRPLSSVFLPKKDKNKILQTINDFLNKESWYIDNGIPYHLGILLYGSPGTGKTSLVRALAGHFNRDIRVLPSQYIYKISTAFTTELENSFIVIEDVDSNPATKSRDVPPQRNKKNIREDIDSEYVQYFQGGLSDILNAMDGIFPAHGRILFMTTNKIENIDSAILRPGRVDLCLEVGYVTPEIFREFVLKYYGKTLPSNITLIKKNITVAELQQKVLEEISFREFKKLYLRNSQ